MAIVMQLSWMGVTPEKYDEALRQIRLDENPPTGQIAHASWFEEGDLHVVDLWNSADDFHRFIQTRLRPVVEGDLGIQSVPNVVIREAHRIDVHGERHEKAVADTG